MIMRPKKLIRLAASVCLLFSTTATAQAGYSAPGLPILAADTYHQTTGNQVTGNGNIVGSGNNVYFIDVPDDYWAKEQIASFAQQGIVNGYQDGSFRPQESVTREEFCKILVTALGQKKLELPLEPTFSDVSEDRWSYPYVEACHNYLTGYSNPNGLPTFRPEADATREDIAVALVKILNYTTQDAKDKDYAAFHFSDGNDISPNLLPYVSIACEKGLMNGYPDGRFCPSKGITRAEIVVLLNRATKQAYTDIKPEIDMTAELAYSTDKQTVGITILAENGTSVTVNGETVTMSRNYAGQYEGRYSYRFSQPGSKEFVVIGTCAGRTKTIRLTGAYEQASVPVLNIKDVPQRVTEKELTFSGTIFDAVSTTTLTLDDDQIASSVAGEQKKWSRQVTLRTGVNTFAFVLTNGQGKTTTITRTVTLAPEAPVLQITHCPTETSQETVTVRGTLYDAGYNAVLRIDGKRIVSATAGEKTNWSETLTLEPGDNFIQFEVTSDSGEKVNETRTIQFTAEAPVLTVLHCPETTASDTETIRVQLEGATKDIRLFINDEQIPVDGGIGEKQVALSPGSNTFVLRAENAFDESTSVTCTILYTPDETT